MWVQDFLGLKLGLSCVVHYKDAYSNLDTSVKYIYTVRILFNSELKNFTRNFDYRVFVMLYIYI